MIPERIKNMIGNTTDTDQIDDLVHGFFDVAILIDKKIIRNKQDNTDTIKRYIDQIAVYSRDNGKNECKLLVDQGKLTGEQ